MKRVILLSWLVALAVLVLAAVPVLAALSAHRAQAARAEALLFERSSEVIASHLRLLTSRQIGWQNALRMRLSSRAAVSPSMLDDLFAPGSSMSLPDFCRALAYGTFEEGRVVLRWQRVQMGVAAADLGEDLLAAPDLGPLLRAAMQRPAQPASVQHGAELITALTVSDTSPRAPRGWIIAWWHLGAMCADSQIGLVSTDRALTARPVQGEIGPSEREIEIRESGAAWRLAVGKGEAFETLFPHVPERAISLTGGGCALLLALLAGFATRAAGLRAALAAERDLVGMKDHLLHSVSHEFRTPLSVILSSTELLEAYADQLPPARRAEALAQIRDSTVRMNEMVEQVLLLSRIEARRLPVQPRPLDIAAFARTLARETETAAHSRCPIRVTAPAKLESALDPALLRAVLGNLLSNAVKFSTADMPVHFTVENGARLRFIVRDHGPGMAAGELPRAREPFFRAASAAEIPGTGLGLTIADKCAALLGGTLAIESGPGGTTATLLV